MVLPKSRSPRCQLFLDATAGLRAGFRAAPPVQVVNVTHHHAGSAVDEDTCALFVATERVTCSTPSSSLHLPPHFTQRVPLLLANTPLHISFSWRLRMIAATAQCWQGMAHGSDDFSLLEEGRSKLLLASVLPQLGAAVEVAKHLTLWEERRSEVNRKAKGN